MLIKGNFDESNEMKNNSRSKVNAKAHNAQKYKQLRSASSFLSPVSGNCNSYLLSVHDPAGPRAGLLTNYAE